VRRRLAAAGNFCLLPVKLIFWPTKLIELFYFRGLRTGRGKKTSWGDRAKTAFLQSGTTATQLVVRATGRKRRKELLFWIPAALACLLVLFVGYRLSIQQSEIHAKYISAAQQAMQSGNIGLAKNYYQRLMDRSALSDAESLQWAMVLQSTGNLQQADAIINSIAPSTGHGYPPGHSLQALRIAKKLDKLPNAGPLNLHRTLRLDADWVHAPSDASQLELQRQFRVHLESADESDPRIHLAWGKYWLYEGEISNGIESLARAGKMLPDLNLDAGKILAISLRQQNWKSNQLRELQAANRRALSNATEHFQRTVNREPLNSTARIQLAASLVAQGEFESARSTLHAGLAVGRSPALQRGLADIFVVQYRESPKFSFVSSQERLEAAHLDFAQLKSAIAADPDYILPYVCLSKLFCSDEDGRQLQKNVLQDLITSDSVTAIDHLNLAAVHWFEQNEKMCVWHLDQAWALEPQCSRQAHCLAIAFAFFSDDQNLPLARLLVDRALLHAPDNPEVLLSHGKVLLEQGDVESAIEQLLKALPQAAFPEDVHQTLKAAYVKMGNFHLAEQHAMKAQRLRVLGFVSGN
jgi:Tfp pilus assembly protein PilF